MNVNIKSSICMLFIFINIHAQEEKNTAPVSITSEYQEEQNRDYKPFQYNLTLKNMHLWRGLRFTDEAVTAAKFYYTSKNKHFSAGFWGGVGFSGNYTEFDYWLSYDYNNWTFSIWDINNYSDFPDANIFNYDIRETSHFVDVSINYNFDSIPLQLAWGTIVLGRDTYVNTNGNLKNALSNYAEVAYTLFGNDDLNLGVFVGAAFSFETEANFYGPKSGFNNVGFTYSTSLDVFGQFDIPVCAKATWNNLQEYSALQVAVNVF